MPKSYAFKIWILLLTFSSGFLNALALERFFFPVSHYTGAVSRAALAFIKGDFKSFFSIFLLFSCFFCGAFVSGAIFYKRKFLLNKRYGLFLMSFAFVLFCVFFFHINNLYSCCIFAFILGMQNGFFIYYDGLIVRTTHITGYLTDAAFALGAALRGNTEKKHFIFFYLISIFCFFSGGIFLFAVPENYELLTASFLYLISGLFYFLLRKRVLKTSCK